MAYDEGLAQRIREALAGTSGLVEKKMFGGIGFLVNGNMACGVNGDALMLRVNPEDYETILKKLHVGVFDFTGKPMRGWVVVYAQGITSPEDLCRWLDQGVAYALTLPPK